MSSLEMNGKLITVQDTFFSKENISTLNKKIIEKNNFHDIPKEGKKQIIDLIIKSMKIVYKSIDLRKINKKNFESIYNQFNQVSLQEVEKELKKKDILTIIQPNAADLKFKRDFDSNPNAGNKVMDRPSSSSNSFLLPPNFDSEKNAVTLESNGQSMNIALHEPVILKMELPATPAAASANNNGATPTTATAVIGSANAGQAPTTEQAQAFKDSMRQRWQDRQNQNSGNDNNKNKGNNKAADTTTSTENTAANSNQKNKGKNKNN
jgi:hypothetical protein